MKRIIISRNQLRKLNEVQGIITADKPGASGVVDAMNKNLDQYHELDGIDGTNSNPQMIIQTPTVNGADVDEKPLVRVNTQGDPSNLSTALNQDSDTKSAVDTDKVNVCVTEKRQYSKRLIEEARLEKMRDEGVVLSKRAFRKSILK